MNKFLYGFMSALTIMLIVGCSSILKNNEGVFGKASETHAHIDAGVRHIENAQAQSNEDKLARIGAWSKGGVTYSLDQIKTNVPREVTIAKEMNARVEALAGKPNFDEVKEIQAIVDNLLSQVAELRNQGEKDLAEKDAQILKLENRVKNLNIQREEEIAGAFANATAVALKADQYKATLNQMDNFFGLGAVFYGLKKFIISAAWILGIGGILFMILRVLASTNPIAASIFSIFDQIFSWGINAIKALAPKAAKVAGLVDNRVFEDYKSTLHKIIDAIEVVKDRNSAVVKAANGSGAPHVTAGSVIQEILDEAGKSMNEDDKSRVADAKKELMWK